MKVFIIDPNLKGIFQKELDGDMNYKDIYKYLHTDVKRCSTFDTVRVRGTNDCIFVDDEGLLWCQKITCSLLTILKVGTCLGMVLSSEVI